MALWVISLVMASGSGSLRYEARSMMRTMVPASSRTRVSLEFASDQVAWGCLRMASMASEISVVVRPRSSMARWGVLSMPWFLRIWSVWSRFSHQPFWVFTVWAWEAIRLKAMVNRLISSGVMGVGG